MPRFFFHVQDGVFTPDREGSDHPDLDGARAGAIERIRHILSDGMLKGVERTHWTMFVADEAGRTVLNLPFSFAVQRD